MLKRKHAYITMYWWNYDWYVLYSIVFIKHNPAFVFDELAFLKKSCVMNGDVFDNTVTTTTHMQYIKYNLRDGKYVLLSTQSYNFTVFFFIGSDTISIL